MTGHASSRRGIQIGVPLLLAVLLSPVGAVALLVLNPYGFLAWLAVSIATLAIAWHQRGRIDGLDHAPARLFVTAMIGCALLAVSSFGFVVATLYAIDDTTSAASDVLDATQLPERAVVLTRHDLGSSSASSATVVFALPEPISAGDVTFPAGFTTAAPTWSAWTCDWQTPQPCEATLIEQRSGAEAPFANGDCTARVTQQSNTVEIDGRPAPVAVVEVNCFESFRPNP